MLLERARVPALAAIERMVGLQAQLARPPFIGLWSRLAGFRRDELLRLLRERRVVRATLMRVTIHMVSARDHAVLRPTLEPMLEQGMRAVLRERVAGVDLEGWIAEARRLFTQRPRTFESLRQDLAKRFPKADPRAMGYAVRTHLPLVMVPTDAPWGFPGAADFALAETRTAQAPKPAALVTRYLAGFGPATPADAQSWSGLRGLGEVFDALRPRLRVFRDQRGRELFDLPDAPRPPEDTPAAPRFVPEYDSLILGHAERSRLMDEQHRHRLATPNLLTPATFFVDGFLAGMWRLELKRSAALLRVEPFVALSRATRDALEREGAELARFVEPEAKRVEVRFATPKEKR